MVFEALVSNMHQRDEHQRDELHPRSKISVAATAAIWYLGPYGYIIALQAAAQRLSALPDAATGFGAKAEVMGPRICRRFARSKQQIFAEYSQHESSGVMSLIGPK